MYLINTLLIQTQKKISCKYVTFFMASLYLIIWEVYFRIRFAVWFTIFCNYSYYYYAFHKLDNIYIIYFFRHCSYTKFGITAVAKYSLEIYYYVKIHITNMFSKQKKNNNIFSLFSFRHVLIIHNITIIDLQETPHFLADLVK